MFKLIYQKFNKKIRSKDIFDLNIIKLYEQFGFKFETLKI